MKFSGPQVLYGLYGIVFAIIVSACASTTEQGAIGSDRGQLLLLPSEQIISMSEKSYDETKRDAQAQRKLDQSQAQYQRVLEVSRRVIPQTKVFRKDALAWKWEVHIISSPELNAYCMPGGKIMFYSGIIEKLKLTDGEIATIMGHEIAHALREHGRERMSAALIQQLGLGALVASGAVDERSAAMASVGVNLFVSLPHGRNQETEADDIGLELMARAGYDPHEAVSLWRKMGAAGGAKPPEILSTHPSDEKRIKKMESLVAKVWPLYLAAKK
ncbi:MAG: peptidase M48 [Bdellovibrio sp. CG10_big_fil_rev_8_21_14_0_10_47_8]|nr:MAG: peptidase M48 [Bdellovibrio sp. CG10_big_fil_rev_8_21_14_0_10_47_8]